MERLALASTTKALKTYFTLKVHFIIEPHKHIATIRRYTHHVLVRMRIEQPLVQIPLVISVVFVWYEHLNFVLEHLPRGANALDFIFAIVYLGLDPSFPAVEA